MTSALQTQTRIIAPGGLSKETVLTIRELTVSTLTVAGGLGAIILCQFWALATPPETVGFSAADCASDGIGLNSRLVVFPFGAREFSIPIPRILKRVVYGASGQILFATSVKGTGDRTVTELPGLVEVQFSPVRVTELNGLDGFYIEGFAVSLQENVILFEGSRFDSTGPTTCGIYRYDTVAKISHAVIETSNCRAGGPWRILNLSPSNKEALIQVSLKDLARLDLATQQISPLAGFGGQLRIGPYSPNGAWIVAVEPFPWRTTLIDPQDFSRRHSLGKSNGNEAVWSPDSRLLLQPVYKANCSRDPFALETVEVRTGKRSFIPNSACHTDSGLRIGWVRNTIEHNRLSAEP